MVQRVVLDTNVRFSALKYGGVPQLLLHELSRLGIQIVTSEALQAELSSILFRKTDWLPAQIQAILDRIYVTTELVQPSVRIHAVRDPDDNRILECAVAGQVDAMITGDKDLLDLGSYMNIPILTVRQFLDDYAQ